MRTEFTHEKKQLIRLKLKREKKSVDLVFAFIFALYDKNFNSGLHNDSKIIDCESSQFCVCFIEKSGYQQLQHSLQMHMVLPF
jgi:hypothetical protein